MLPVINWAQDADVVAVDAVEAAMTIEELSAGLT